MDQRSIAFVLCAFLLVKCSQDEQPVYNVPDDAQVFVDRFVQEGKARGVDLSISNLIIQYEGDIEETLCGSCNSLSKDPTRQKIIIINQELQCWGDSNELEALIFHELGHCVLNRDHENAKLLNGDPKSLMVQTSISMYQGCVYQISDDPCNFTFKREYYLDELFDQLTPPPDWVNN